VVVICDPPPARGQPARQHRLEDTSQRKTQLQICPSNRVNLSRAINYPQVFQQKRAITVVVGCGRWCSMQPMP